MSVNDEMNSEDEYLKRHLREQTSKPKKEEINEETFYNEVEPIETGRTTDLQYLSFDVRDLPCGIFYPIGTTLKVRAAQVIEIQSYSTIDDQNLYDVVDKLNDMLMSCVRIKYPSGKMGSYLDLKDPDRLYLIFLIRELTFQEGNNLAVSCTCPTCNTQNSVEILRKNFVYNTIDEKLGKFFDSSKLSFIFNVKNGRTYEIAPPTIGIQKAFSDYILTENAENRKPNLSFLKIIPFMLPGKTSITQEGIKAKLHEFQSIDDVSFQFLNSAVSKMGYGIKELKKTCECGQEIHTEMQFPNGIGGIFVIHDAFEAYIQE